MLRATHASFYGTGRFLLRAMSAQNSGKTAKPRGRPFPKGQSGNPGGRPKSLSRLIREQTEDGAELVSIALSIARGELVIRDTKIVDKSLVPVDTYADHMGVLNAVKLLAAYGYGTPIQSVEISGPAGGPVRLNLADCTEEDLDALERISAKVAPESSDDSPDPSGEGSTPAE